MGKGSSGVVADTSYQGAKGYSKAQSTGISVEQMSDKIDSLPDMVKKNNQEAISVINSVKNNPNARVTMYRATIGNGINNGDWVFLDKQQAQKWTKTAFGTPKPGVKVVTKTVKAKDIDWTGKNLEFMYNPKKKKGK